VCKQLNFSIYVYLKYAASKNSFFKLAPPNDLFLKGWQIDCAQNISMQGISKYFLCFKYFRYISIDCVLLAKIMSCPMSIVSNSYLLKYFILKHLIYSKTYPRKHYEWWPGAAHARFKSTQFDFDVKLSTFSLIRPNISCKSDIAKYTTHIQNISIYVSFLCSKNNRLY